MAAPAPARAVESTVTVRWSVVARWISLFLFLMAQVYAYGGLVQKVEDVREQVTEIRQLLLTGKVATLK